jgi:hypothetical protein
MRRKTTQVMIMSLLLTGAATLFGGYVYAADDDSETTTKVSYRPYKPSNPSAEVGEVVSGKATVTLTFTTPDQSYDTYYGALDKDEEPLTEITDIVVAEREADEWDFDYVYTVVKRCTGNIEIGKEMSVVLKDQAEGKHTYFIIALNSASPSDISKSVSSSSVSIDVTVGVVYEAPAAVTDLTYTDNYPEITLSWTAPEKGKNGGSIKTSELTYDVYRGSKVIASDITATTYTDKLELTEPTELSYSVVAKTSLGSSSKVTTDKFVEGPAYEIPFTETFDGGSYGGSPSHIWSSASTTSELSTSTYVSNTATGVTTNKLEGGYDGDNGALYIKQNGRYFGYVDEDEEEVEGVATYTSAPISLKDAKRPALSFYQYIAPSEKNVLKGAVLVEQNGEQTVLNEYTYTEGTEGWQAESYDLSKFVGGDIKLIFKGSALNSAYGFTAFDVIKIEESNDYDLVLTSFTAPSNVDAGEEYTASAEIFNKGVKAAENFNVELYLNGKLFKTETVASLAAGESTTVEFKAKADNSYGTSAAFELKVVLEGDAVPENNTATATMAVRTAAAPAVSDLAAESADNVVTLKWSEPDYKLPEAQNVVESFEDYVQGATSFGSWTMSAAHSYGPDFEDLGLDEDTFTGKATFTVVDSEVVGTDWGGKASDGTKYLMNVGKEYYRTDWLISPVLSGSAQTVTFKIASRKFITDWFGDDYNDHVKVYYSTTTNEQTAFKTSVVDQDIKASLKAGDDFETISAELPEGATYFAIVISNNEDEDGESVVFIDEISFEQGADGVEPELVGYDVYDNGEKITETPVTDTTYVVEQPADGSHKYTVVVVYNVGESEASNEVELSTSGVKNLDAANVKVYATAGEIHINATAAQVFDLAGRKLAQTRGNSVVNVAAGTYIVRADNKTVKLVVK